MTMTSVLKSTSLALLAVSTVIAIGCGRNSQPDRYQYRPYGNGGNPNTPFGANPNGVPVDSGAPGAPGPGGVVGGPGGPVGPGGPGGYGPGAGGAGGQGDWHSFNCSVQNIDNALSSCLNDSERYEQVRTTLINSSGSNYTFPVWLMYSRSLLKKMSFEGNERTCIRQKICSAKIQQARYASGREPRFDATQDFNDNQNGQDQGDGQYQQGRRGQNQGQANPRLPQRDPNQNADQNQGEDPDDGQGDN